MKRGLQVVVADNLRLPYRSESIDFAISIAVIHHFATKERRQKAIREILRILKPKGRICIYVWAFEQKDKQGKQKYSEQDVFVAWNLQSVYQKKDDELPKDENGKVVFQRYYHMFKKGELEDLVIDMKDIKIIDCQLEKENWCVIIEKIK